MEEGEEVEIRVGEVEEEHKGMPKVGRRGVMYSR